MSFNSYVSPGWLLCDELHASGHVLAHADLPLSRPTVLHKPKCIVSTRHVSRDSPVPEDRTVASQGGALWLRCWSALVHRCTDR